MLLFFVFFLSHAQANDCPLTPDKFWQHYADEWGHEEKIVEKLKEKDITIGSHSGKWVYWPRTCTKHGCDVSFLLKLAKENCWKPLISVQGRLRAHKKNDWFRFKNTFLRSSVDQRKKSEQLWVFDEKEKTFKQSFKKPQL